MARATSLKVYRTVIGFHDAYVAAPSQKAALEAWGSDKNLFARGLAEQVTDEALTTEALASPGTVFRRLRGTAEEQIAALPPDKPEKARSAQEPGSGSAPRHQKRPAPDARPVRKPQPRPSRAALDQAERLVGEAETRQATEQAEQRRREQEVQQQGRDMRARQRDEMRLLEQARAEADTAYRQAIAAWRTANN